MDQQRFDAALRALQAGTTRRAGLAGMLSVLLGGVGAEFDAAAKGRGRARERERDKRGAAPRRGRRSDPIAAGPCGDGTARDNRCASNGDCCTKYCANGACRCEPNWMRCRRGAQCCSGNCVGRRCDGGAKPAGSACTHNFNCQSGLACIAGECTPSSKASCTAQNCKGCCDGTTCRTGKTRQGCGVNAVACAVCTGTAACVAGVCGGNPGGSCSAATCPNGCCKDGACTAGTSDSACGVGGEECEACTGGDACQAQVCSPFCDATSCPNGCCAQGICETGTVGQACGAGGVACVVCASSQALCVAGACASGTWAYKAQMGTGTSGSGTDQFAAPYRVWVAADELTAWISDIDNHRVAVWTRADATAPWAYLTQLGTGTAGSGPNQFNQPFAVVVSPDELTAYVADKMNYRVSVWTRPNVGSTAWSYLTQLGTGTEGSGNSQFRSPWGLFVSADQLTAYIADNLNYRVSVWTRADVGSTAWSYQTQLGTGISGSLDDQFKSPVDVQVSSDGLTAWISDSGNHRIAVWARPDASSAAWAYKTQLGNGTGGPGTHQFNYPAGIFVSSDGLSVWIADYFNNRVPVWTRPDVGSTAWAYQTKLGTGTGGPATDQFKFPGGVFASADARTAWIADGSNYRVSIWEQNAP